MKILHHVLTVYVSRCSWYSPPDSPDSGLCSESLLVIHVLIVPPQKLKATQPPLIKNVGPPTLELNFVLNRLKNNSFWHLTNSPDPLFAHAKVQCCYVSVYRAFTTLIKTTLSLSAQPSYNRFAQQQVNLLSTGVTNLKGGVVFASY